MREGCSLDADGGGVGSALALLSKGEHFFPDRRFFIKQTEWRHSLGLPSAPCGERARATITGRESGGASSRSGDGSDPLIAKDERRSAPFTPLTLFPLSTTQNQQQCTALYHHHRLESEPLQPQKRQHRAVAQRR